MRDIFSKPYFDSISLELHISGCPNTCRHCKDDGRRPFGALMSLDEAKWIVKQFSDLTESNPPAVKSLGALIHYEPTAHPDFLSLQEYCLEVSDNSEDLIGTFSTNGYGIVRDDDYLHTLNRLKEQGFNAIKSTLHGLEEHHDWFVCRKGAFRDIFLTAEKAAEAGMVVGFNIYLDKYSTKDFLGLIDFIRRFEKNMSDRFGSSEIGISVVVPDFIVGSKRLRVYESKLRPRLSDLEALRPELEQFMKPPYDKYTEGYWTEKVLNQPLNVSIKQIMDEAAGESDTEFYERNAILAVDRSFDVYERSFYYDWSPVKQGNLKTDGVMAILERVREFQPREYPDIPMLAQGFGDKNSKLIHTKLSSLRNKWIDAWINAKHVHLCVTRSELIRPKDMWQVRWITEDDHEAFAKPFRKWDTHGWTLEEFRQYQSEGNLFCGVFFDGRLCALAGLWKRAEDVWEVIAVGTMEEYQHRGMAKSCVYFMAEYIFQHCEVASYGTWENNIASIRTAQSVGFKYCTNIVNNDRWCAHNPRPSVKDVVCPLLKADTYSPQ